MAELKTKSNQGVLTSLVVAVVFFAIIYAALYAYTATSEIKSSVQIGEKKINVELAQTQAEMYQGLSDRKKLGNDEGMLFVYDGYYMPTYVMRNMLFPIDIVWIKDDMVVGFEKELVPEPIDNLTGYQPNMFVNYVLEVNAGFVDENQIRIGDRVVIRN